MHFSNFRALRDVEIRFSNDEARRLTVIRAENGTGKTSALLGLQWAFFGDEGLPKAGKGVRLYPIDWDDNSEPRVEIAVEVSFVVVQSRTRRDGTAFEEAEEYLLRRSCSESPANEGERTNSDVTLMRLGPDGYRPLANPRVVLEDLLPPSLREVFFTDGDRAKTFVDSDVSATAKRARVAAAVRSLLGLDLLEDASGHAREAVRTLQGNIGKGSDDDQLKGVGEQLVSAERKVEQRESSLRELRDQGVNLDETLSSYESDLADALVKGDRQELSNQLERYRGEAALARQERAQHEREQAELLRSDVLSQALVMERVQGAAVLLRELKDTGAIPKTFLPFVSGQLATGVCICGTSLADGTDARARVEHLIDHQHAADAVTDRLTTLQVLVQQTVQSARSPSELWSSRMTAATEALERAEDRQRAAEEGEKETGRSIELVSDADVGYIRKQISQTKEHSARVQREIGLAESDLRAATALVVELQTKQSTLARQAGKYKQEQARLIAARDVLAVLERTISNIQRGRLLAVSGRMNELFLEVIGVDPDSRSLVTEARITPEHDIEVVGPEGRLLDPQLDLNGAAQRALTLALVLALANVSGVSAPNVIDTPLGMTSDNVRSNMVDVGSRNSTQLVLFLTRAEIHGVEGLLDATVGEMVTLTNAQHWPSRLVNPPLTDHLEVLTCECDHRHFCSLCERKNDRDSGLLERAR